jgi:hypothetical protein
MSAPDNHAPPDLEVGGGWKAERARWQRRGRVEVRTTGDPETEEHNEKPAGPAVPEPDHAYRGAAHRWWFSAWLRGSDRG